MEVTQSISKRANWNLFTLITFRFFFIYFILKIFPFPLTLLQTIFGETNDPFSFSFYTNWIEELAVWTGKNILGITYEMPIGPNGSGDTTTDYVIQFIISMIAVITTIAWTIVDSKKKNYNIMLLYLRTYVRYYLATILLVYGFIKIVPLQFSELSLFDLIKPYGNSSPMGLMWNFMEYSDFYTIFSGSIEVIAGIFLLFRRTILLGALITIGAMGNVLMLNLSYDIPVKLYSFIYTLMGVFLLAPDLKRILNFLILNKTVVPKTITPYFTKPKLKNTAVILKFFVIILLFYSNITRVVEGQRKWGKKAPKPSLYGIYEVGSFVKNGDIMPPLTTDTIRWKRLIVSKRSLGIQTMDEKIKYFSEETDTIAKTLQITNRKDSTDIQRFTYKFKDSLYTFESVYKSDTLKIVAKKKEREEFLLINRGFHWINEFPFNR